MRIPPSMTTEIAPSPELFRERRIRSLTLAQDGTGLPPRALVPGQSYFELEERGTLVFGRDPGPDGVTLDDARASRQHLEIGFDRRAGRFWAKDLGSKNGSFLNAARLEEAELSPGAVLRIGDTLLVYSEIVVPDGLPTPEPRPGVSPARALAEAGADLAAPTELPILIIGPTGAGKEVMSQRIHERSGRRGKLTAVNCSTFSRELIGSELFGHTAGAFSGAKVARSGLFVAADGGTLFLDEIAELPLEQQPALLRALQERKVRPVGSDREVEVDVRVIAATHQSLDSLVERGAFREDLYARLAGFVLDLPALAERREEILPLFRLFLGELAKPLTTEAAEALLVHDWPQNIRELKHAAERTRLFIQNLDKIGLGALPPHLKARPQSQAAGVRPSQPATRPSQAPARPSSEAPDDEPPSREELVQLLTTHGGNVAQVARALSRHRQQVYRWLKRFDLDAEAYRPEEG